MKPLHREMQAELVALTHRWLERAERWCGQPLAPVEIRFDLQGAAAGQYRAFPLPCIRYNMAVAAAQFETFRSQTPPHEVAHHVVAQLHGERGVKPHGKEWWAVMNAFGVAPRRCHEFDLDGVPVRRQRRFRYRCACREHELSATRHNRVRRGRARYFCRACGEALKPA